LFKLIVRLYRGKWALALASFVCLIVLSFDGVVFPYFLGRLTDILTEQAYNQVPLLLILWFIIWLLLVFFQFLNSYFFGKVRRDINIDLKDMMFRRSYEAGNSRVPTSKYISIITSDIKQIEKDFVDNSMNFIYCILQTVVTLVFLLFINWQVGLVFVLLGFLPTFIPRLTSKWLKKGTEKWQEANHSYIKQLEDGFNGRNLIKRYRAIDFIFTQLSRALSNEQHKYFTMNIRQGASSLFVSTLYVVSALASLSFGAWMVIQGNITVGMLITIYMAADRVTTPLIALTNFYNTMIGSEPLLRKVLEDKPEHEPPKLPEFTGSEEYLIALEDVHVGYDESEPILQDLNVQIQQGDKILIEGPSGSGKSTLLKTIMNEMDALSGNIKYGKELKGNITDSFAVVEQQPFVFHNTLRYNLTLGKKVSDEKIYEILHNVGLKDLANKEGINIQLGSDTHQLSGGELKRLEVARAILYGKDILVVDEALSGLDNDNANRLNKLIIDYPGTVINIEHRLDEEISKRFNKKLELNRSHTVMDS